MWANRLFAAAVLPGDGESWRSSRKPLLSEGGAMLTIGGDGTRMVRVRCSGEL